MFGKKQKEIAKLQIDLNRLKTEAIADFRKLLDLGEKLETAHEQIKDLAYENDDLNRKIDLLESVLKQLNISVKLATRKASERVK